jgi:serine/threonine-protein kinase
VKLGACQHCGAALVQGAFGCPRCGHLVDDHEIVDTSAAHPTQLGTLAKDALLDGHWRLIEPLGRGRRATVWVAHDVSFDRKVALKLLDESRAKDRTEVERFERDARRLAAIEHRNVVSVLAMGAAQGIPFVVMRRAEGRSLAEHVHARGGKLPPSEAAHVLKELSAAFEAVHAQGGAQGGLQTRHVFIADDGRVTLLEVRAGQRPTDAQTAVFDRVDGMAPEVLRGAEPSVASDVFALGCLAWELIAGVPPNRGPLDLVLAGKPRAIPAVPIVTPLNDVIARAVADDPAARFASAAELEAAAGAVAAAMPKERATLQVVELPVAAAVVEAVTAPRPAPDFTRPAPAAAPRVGGPEFPTQPLPAVTDAPRTERENRDNATRHFNVAELELKRSLAAQQRPVLPRERRQRAMAVIAISLLVAAFLLFSYERRPEPTPLLPQKIAGVAPAPPSPPDPIISMAPVPEEIRDREKSFKHAHDEAAALKDGRHIKGNARIGRRVSEYPFQDAQHRPMSELNIAVLLNSKPVDADVFIDRKLIGPSPVYEPVPAGPHLVGAERRPITVNPVTINVPPGKSVRVEIELEPLVDGSPAP